MAAPALKPKKAKSTATYRAPNGEIIGRDVQLLVEDLIGRVADKWTMITLELLVEHGTLRFTELLRHIGNISQKMLTQTLRNMERDGLISRTVYPVVPPKVEYQATKLGVTLGEAFCGVWEWAEKNLKRVEGARATFDQKQAQT